MKFASAGRLKRENGMNEMTRRTLLRAGAALAAVSTAAAQPSATKLKIAIFSKHLEFLEGEELARGAAELGVEGIDLAVRRGGHVEPERVKQDLPALVAAIRKQGLEVPMLTTDISDADTPYADDILAAMTDLGIHHYRWGGYKWKNDTPISKQLEAFKPRVAKLAALNGRYQASAMYHTHSGVGLVGASIWDLHEILSGFDPRLVGVNYDIGHATVEGGLGGWIESLRITGPYLRGVAVKDFLWEKDAKGQWQAMWKPLGEGMVKFPRFFDMLREAQFAGPLQLHFEYPLGGAENGKKKDLSMSRADIYAAMKRDVKTLRGMLQAAKLA
jgi:sugar phosphate isomerase/epimerase